MLSALFFLCGDLSVLADVTPAATEKSDVSAVGLPDMRAGMTEVKGEWTENEGRVVWQLESTWGTAGFHVYRVNPESGEETSLNETLLPAAFYDAGAAYEVVDPEAVEGGEGTYRLEETEFSGAVFDLGTHAVVFARPPAPAKMPRTTKAAPAPKSLPSSGPSATLKVLLRDEGIYGVSLESIAAGMGRSLGEIQALAEVGALEISEQGRSVPTIYDAARGRLIFHGKPPDNWYARDAAYLIREGAGQAMSRRGPGATQGVSTLPAQIRFEQDVFPFDAVVQRPADFYYWNFVISTTNPASNRVDFAFSLDGYGGDALTLRVDMQGWSKTTARNPDHRAEFSVNGTPVGSVEFDDQNAATAVLAIPSGVASNGANVLTVRGAVTNASYYSYFVLDGFTAEYDRDIVPGSGAAIVRAGGAASVSAAAFAEPLALALDEAGDPTWIAGENGEWPAKAWAVASSNERYAVIEADAVPLLAPVPAAADAWFLAETNRIDYLVIASRALAPAAQELADYRAGQGLRTGVAVFEDVCDLMAGGLRTPEAIPALMRFAAATWAESPRMLVLAGNGHYDYLESMGTEVNHLPPMLRQTYDGLFASDELMADIGGDELPDVAVGRLPACTSAELAAMIAKIKAYEAEFGSEWQNRLVFANDKADAAGNFAASIARFTNLVQNPFSVSARANLDMQAIAPARAAFLGGFSNGAGIVHYTGHGTSVKLSSQGLLAAADVGAMSNARTPFVALLCCLAGHYEAPAVNSLGELLMQRTQGGAVSVWASSALPLNAPATDLGEAFYRAVLLERTGPLGRALLQGRRSLPGDIFTKNSFATYNLLGDPALRLAGNDPASTPDQPAQVFLQGLSQTCDFTPRAATATTLPAGLAVQFTYDGCPAPPPLPGSYAVTARVATAYYSGSATGTLTIAKPPAAVSLENLSQTYDGMPKSATATTVPAGLSVRFTYGGVPNAPTAVGNYFVVATVDDAVWEGTATGMLTVAKAPATVMLDGLSQTYDGAPKSATVSTIPAGLPVELTYGGAPSAPSGAGSYAVMARVVSATYAGLATGTLAVAKAAATVTLNGMAQTYDGAPRVVTATTVPDELAVDILYDGLYGAPTSAGTYAVSGTVSDPNWQGAATGALVVAKAGQTIDFPPIANQWATNVVVLSALASSGLPVSFAVAEGPGLIAGGTSLTFLGSGTVSVAAAQVGNANWAAAPEEVRTFAVAYDKPIPEISATYVRVRENGEGRLHVRLFSKPSGSLVISVSRAWGSTNLAVKGGSTLTFKSTTWSAWQTVTLAATDDAGADGETAVFRISAPGLSDMLVTAAALDDDIGPNLALASGGATISGTKATNAALAIDGVHTSSANYGAAVWTSTPPGTLTLDLKTTTTVSRLRLLNPDWTCVSQRYRIEGSRDGAAWNLLADASAEGRCGWDEWMVSGVARYLRFTGLSNSANSSVGVAEWEVYGTPWSKEPATVALEDLAHLYDGTPKQPRAITAPAELAVDFTYDGASTAPSAAGTYAVVCTIRDEIYQGSATGTLSILTTTNLFEEWVQNAQRRSPGDPSLAPDADADGDGATTWQEFLADTDPNDPGEVLVLTGEYVDAAQAGEATGQIRFSFPASTNRFYQLEYCVDLATGTPEAVNLGWGVPGMAVTNTSTGTWFGVIRVLLQEP